ncbi:hypothetical protein SUBVAR_05102 [Subdoligranulum variabile DSM 15176]|uniref:Uncharacterized protein n=1 Tax=Subdoligranulum variabile DSM 15176 TaxID=411471 RepID=D1PL64_9FIRM|nr:hypothetical protein SUBVAR_05102 [Subdoligranulum variabile DSM 15176]
MKKERRTGRNPLDAAQSLCYNAFYNRIATYQEWQRGQAL